LAGDEGGRDEGWELSLVDRGGFSEVQRVVRKPLSPSNCSERVLRRPGKGKQLLLVLLVSLSLAALSLPALFKHSNKHC
jgi:hypothetical protein